MKEENNIDQYFRSELSDHQAAPSEAVWENISAELGPEDDETVAVLPWKGIAVLLAGLLLLVSGLFCWNTSKLKKEKMAIEQQYNTELALKEAADKEEALIAQYAPSHEKAQTVSTPSTAGEEEYYTKPQDRNSNYEKKAENQTLVDSDPTAEDPAFKTWKQVNAGRTFDDPTDALPLQGGGSMSERGDIPNPDEYSEYADIALLHYTPITIAMLDYKRPQNNIKAPATTSQRDRYIWPNCSTRFNIPHPWFAGIVSYQNNTFRRINAQNPEGNTQRSQLNGAEKPGTSYGIRAFAAYALSPRISISGGLELSKWQQAGLYDFQYRFDQSNIVTSSGNIEATIDAELTTSTGVSNVELLSSFDASSLPWSGFEGNVSRTAEVRTQESITWLSTPISLRYQTIKDRLGISGGAGLAYDRLITSTVVTEVNSDFDQATTSEIQYSRDGFISAHAAAGLHYWVTDAMKISAGPRFKSWLVPLYSDQAIKTYPYSGSIELGLEIKL